MKRTLYSWFMLFSLLMPNACETSDPASLPRSPISGFSSDVALHVLSPTSAASTSLALEINAMRARQYPGSDILIESALDPGVNYSRYYVSYLSEGLKIYALMTVPSGQKPATGWPVIIFNHGFIPPDVYVSTE